MLSQGTSLCPWWLGDASLTLVIHISGLHCLLQAVIQNDQNINRGDIFYLFTPAQKFGIYCIIMSKPPLKAHADISRLARQGAHSLSKTKFPDFSLTFIIITPKLPESSSICSIFEGYELNMILKFPDFSQTFEDFLISLTNLHNSQTFPWPWRKNKFPWLIPDQWAPC